MEECPEEFELHGKIENPTEGSGTASSESNEVESDFIGPSVPSQIPLGVYVFSAICLAVIPDVVNAINSYLSTERYTGSFYAQHSYVIARSLYVSIPLLLIMKLAQDDWREHGFKPFNVFYDLLPAILLYCIAIWANSIVLYAINFSGMYSFSEIDYFYHFEVSPSNFWIGLLLLTLSSFANGFAEELVMRAYLIPKLEKLFGSSFLAILLTTGMFASYHIYQGMIGVFGAIVIGYIFGAFFVLTRRIWPLVFVHAAMDFLPILPYL